MEHAPKDLKDDPPTLPMVVVIAAATLAKITPVPPLRTLVHLLRTLVHPLRTLKVTT